MTKTLGFRISEKKSLPKPPLRKGISIFIDRLEHEVNACRTDAPHELKPRLLKNDQSPSNMETDQKSLTDAEINSIQFTRKGVQCMPQRSALLKSILNFLKKTITDQAMAETVRHMMESSLPKSRGRH